MSCGPMVMRGEGGHGRVAQSASPSDNPGGTGRAGGVVGKSQTSPGAQARERRDKPVGAQPVHQLNGGQKSGHRRGIGQNARFQKKMF